MPWEYRTFHFYVYILHSSQQSDTEGIHTAELVVSLCDNILHSSQYSAYVCEETGTVLNK